MCDTLIAILLEGVVAGSFMLALMFLFFAVMFRDDK